MQPEAAGPRGGAGDAGYHPQGALTAQHRREGEMEGREAGGQRGALRRDRRPQAKPPTLRPLG